MSERLTAEDVFEACNKILDSGEKPSTPKLHRLLGRGSYTTIQKHLNSWLKTDTWVEASINQAPPEDLPLPPVANDAMELALKTIWNAASSSAKDVLEVHKRAVDSQLTEQEKIIETTINSNDLFQNQVKAQQGELELLKTELSSATNENGKLRGQLESSTATVTELKNANVELRASLESKSGVEANNLELTVANKQLNDLVVDLRSQLEAEQERTKNATDTLSAINTELSDALIKNQGLQDSLSAASAELSDVRVSNATLTATNDSLKAVNSDLTARIVSIEKAKNDGDIEIKGTRKRLDETNAELSAASAELRALGASLAAVTTDKERLEVENDKLTSNLNQNISDYVGSLSAG
ncbi:DNA-binding protein [Vibrio astriarenae]